MSIIIFIIILLILVVVHEAGHFFTAKSFGIRVDEFGFGFPPKLFGIKKGETEYTINALPFGGFVKIYGESSIEENNSNSDLSRSLIRKPKWQQSLVMFAGIFANFILAGILFSIVFFMGSPLATDSIPSNIKNKMTEQLIVLSVNDNTPASRSGIKNKDIIYSVETKNEKIIKPTLAEFINFSNKPGENIHISIIRNGEENFVDVVPEENISLGRAFVGISPGVLLSGKFNFFESFKYGFQTAVFSAKDTFVAFGKLFKGGEESKQLRDSVIGPVGLVKVTGIVSEFGIGYLLSFMAVISISLAVINLLPFPALDGGRLLFLLIEKIKGSRINPKIADNVNMVGFFLLIILMLLVTYHDIVKLL
ncbi:MAG: RIP metalloprotease RseP [Candidatus Paceibacterota bacterium]|jgi:regulator of sigma E protease